MRFLLYCAAIAAIVSFLPGNTHAQFAGIGGHTRLSDGPNAEANGGLDTSLIGLNTAGINNWGINQWDLSSIAGDTVTEVSLNFILPGTPFTNGNHGSAMDSLSLHEMYSTNAGWLEGGQVVNAGNVGINDWATYNFQAQTDEVTGTPWQDASGADVANFLGSFDPVAIDTVDGWASGSEPESGMISFNIPIALAQTWVDDPASFAGLVLVSDDVDNDSRSRRNFPGNPATLVINPLDGDFDIDADVDADDVDLLSANLGSPASTNPDMDLNGDDTIDLADHDLHITTQVQDANGIGALIGDLNLDGDVDVSEITIVDGTVINSGDASVLLANLGQATEQLYAGGDLNGDGDVDVSQIVVVGGAVQNLGDASRLLANLGQSTAPQGSSSAAAVPEPSGISLLGLTAATMLTRRRR